MAKKTTMRAAIYLRVSTGDQTVENQRRDLEAAAAHRGWIISATYADEGISSSKSRDKRPGLDAMLKDATRGRFDVVMAWAVDRMGRSLPDLIGTMQDLHAARVDLFLHQQAIDTTTPSGRAMFQMMGVFAEFERAMIVARVKAGMDRAKAVEAAGKVRRDAQGRRKLVGRAGLARPSRGRFQRSGDDKPVGTASSPRPNPVGALLFLRAGGARSLGYQECQSIASRGCRPP